MDALRLRLSEIEDLRLASRGDLFVTVTGAGLLDNLVDLGLLEFVGHDVSTLRYRITSVGRERLQALEAPW
jgi:hypothetical protein